MRLPVVVMGVSGCGKSSLAQALGERLGLDSADADDLHAPEAVAKMRQGTPLTDDDRWPWLDRVGTALADAQAHPQGLVMACSALRRAYRNRLRGACQGLRFVFLHGEPALIEQRLQQRHGHYMPPGLLHSQLQTLEHPGADEADVLALDIAAPLPALAQQAADGLTGQPREHP